MGGEIKCDTSPLFQVCTRFLIVFSQCNKKIGGGGIRNHPSASCPFRVQFRGMKEIASAAAVITVSVASICAFKSSLQLKHPFRSICGGRWWVLIHRIPVSRSTSVGTWTGKTGLILRSTHCTFALVGRQP